MLNRRHNRLGYGLFLFILMISFQNCSPHRFQTKPVDGAPLPNSESQSQVAPEVSLPPPVSPPEFANNITQQTEVSGNQPQSNTTTIPATATVTATQTASINSEECRAVGGIDVRPYWQVEANRQIVKLFRDRYGSVWHKDSRRETSYPWQGNYRLVTLLTSAAIGRTDGQWLWHSTWNYSVDHSGVNEFSDQFANLATGELSRSVEFEANAAIFWGKCLKKEPHYAVARIKGNNQGIARGTVGYDGYQMVQLATDPSDLVVGGKTYSNVIGVAYVQAWCQDRDCSTSASAAVEAGLVHAVYYMAPGYGIIRRDYYTAGFAQLIKTEEAVEICSLPFSGNEAVDGKFFCP